LLSGTTSAAHLETMGHVHIDIPGRRRYLLGVASSLRRRGQSLRLFSWAKSVAQGAAFAAPLFSFGGIKRRNVLQLSPEFLLRRSEVKLSLHVEP
jgi:hypothetical protein